MEISESQTARSSLEQFAHEAIAKLRDGDFAALAERFGYACAYGRDLASAIEADMKAALSDDMDAPGDVAPYMTIKYFNAEALKSTGLVAAVDCVTHLADGTAVDFSLVVTGKGAKRYLTLESIQRAL